MFMSNPANSNEKKVFMEEFSGKLFKDYTSNEIDLCSVQLALAIFED